MLALGILVFGVDVEVVSSVGDFREGEEGREGTKDEGFRTMGWKLVKMRAEPILIFQASISSIGHEWIRFHLDSRTHFMQYGLPIGSEPCM